MLWLKVSSKLTWAVVGRTAPLGAYKNACHSCPVLSPVLVPLIIIQRAAITFRCMLIPRSPQRQKDVESKISQCRGKERMSSVSHLPKEGLLNILCLHMLPPGGECIFSCKTQQPEQSQNASSIAGQETHARSALQNHRREWWSPTPCFHPQD